MGPRNKKWCQTNVVKAIQNANPGFKHTCSASRNNAVYVCGSLIDEYYCTAERNKNYPSSYWPV